VEVSGLGEDVVRLDGFVGLGSWGAEVGGWRAVEVADEERVVGRGGWGRGRGKGRV